MTKTELETILELHRKWLNEEEGGEIADLSGANLRRANLSEANLSGANLSGANLRRANLSEANLSGANLREADLSGADLSEANLSEAYLSEAYLGRANLTGANLTGANLRRAILGGANLRGADLSGADLGGANLSGANLSETNLTKVNLSGAQGLLDPIAYLTEHFERTSEGYVVYKSFDAIRKAPEYWKIEPGAILTEIVNPNRTDDCGCGINVAPLSWVREDNRKQVYQLLIRWEWLPGVVVPYNTDGKIRCGRAQIMGPVEEED